MKSRSAFTLIELLVVITLIVLLIAILLPVLSSAREVARSAVCMSQLKQLGIAEALYTFDYDEYVPAASMTDTGSIEEFLEPYVGKKKGGNPGDLISQDVMYCPTNEGLDTPPSGGYLKAGAYYKGWSGYIFGYHINGRMHGQYTVDVITKAVLVDTLIRVDEIKSPSILVSLNDLRGPRTVSSPPPRSSPTDWRYFHPAHPNVYVLATIHNDAGNILLADGHVATYSSDQFIPLQAFPDRARPFQNGLP